MNGPHGYLTPDTDRSLLLALLVNAPEMNFFRFCELMDLAAPDRPPLGSTDTPADDPVRFRSRARLGFPAREIDGVECDPDDSSISPTVRTTFLGLYGVDARMPSHFVDEIAQNRDGAESMAALLDLFHHRVITQYYRIWRKYRYPAGFRNDATDETSRYLLSLVGLGMDNPEMAQMVGTRKLLAMLGLANQKTRTAEGLVGVLQHAVPDAQITVEECYPVWSNAAGYAQNALGDGCLLGRGFYDRANAVRIVITPQTHESVLGLTPGQPNHSELTTLLRFYLGYEAKAYLEMHVAAHLMPAPVLNSNQVTLGYTTQLPPPRTSDLTTITRVQLAVWTGGSKGNARPCSIHQRNTNKN